MKPPFQAAVLIVSLAWLVPLSGCSTPGPKPDPIVSAFDRSEKAIASAVREGIDESESVDAYVVAARLNPCQCDAPPHEIYIHGRWTRAYLDTSDALREQIDERLGEDADNHELAPILLEGAVDGQRRSERGVEHPIFEIDGLREDSASPLEDKGD